MSERKASEILISIENQIENLSKKLEYLSKNVDLISFNQKILLDRVNKLKPEVPQNFSEKNEISKAEVTTIKNSEQSTQITSATNKKFKETTVFQKVFYPDKSPVILCKVRILDIDNNEIKVTKTIADGKWTAILPPGTYKVHLIKDSLINNKKPKIDRLHPFDVDGSSPALELNSSKE